MRTRPALPVELHIAAGTYRPARHGKSNATSGTMLDAIPDPPASLEASGKVKWQSIGTILQIRGLLQGRYLDALEMLCRAYDRLERYQAVLAKDGEFYTTKRGAIGAHPAVRLLAVARDDIRRYLIEFGMTPSSSNGIDVPPPSGKSVPSRIRDLKPKPEGETDQ